MLVAYGGYDVTKHKNAEEESYLAERPQFRRFNILRPDIISAGDLNRRRQVGQHHAQRFLVLRDIVRQRARHRILQKHLVGLQPSPVQFFHLRRVEIHGHHTDRQQHAQDDVDQRDPRRDGQFQWQWIVRRPGRSGGYARFGLLPF